MMNALVAGQSGVNLIHDCGYLAGGMVGSTEQAVIANDIVGMAKRIVQGVRVDDDHLAVDVIKEVGPGGNFMAHKHTRDHVDEFLLPELFDRNSFGTWQSGGAKETRTIAKEKVEEILKEHKPEPLGQEIRENITKVINEGEKKLITKQKEAEG
jgi:trimethylamine--corrinoid protein Co-methyltransferase